MLGFDEGVILGPLDLLSLATFDGSIDATADGKIEGSSVVITLG